MSLALIVLVFFVGAYFYLTYFRLHPDLISKITLTLSQHQNLLSVVFGVMILNFAIIGAVIKRSIGLEQQGSKLAILDGRRKDEKEFSKLSLYSVILGGASFCLLRPVTIEYFGRILDFVPSKSVLALFAQAVAVNMAFTLGIAFKTVCETVRKFHSQKLKSAPLDAPKFETGHLVLGTTPNVQAPLGDSESESWVSIPPRGVNGGILVTGSVGSGKTQATLLRYLPQLVSDPKNVPAMLLIDPKGTYLKEAEKLLREAGLGNRIVRWSQQRTNVLYAESALRNSQFLSLAEMTRAAAINFMGKASDSPFWEISSNNLIRNGIVACAALHGYFTLSDLYTLIIEASEREIGRDLKLRLVENEEFDEEERYNIKCAIRYFEDEYAKLEDRVRTGIMATSTAFINQFQEYTASRIFCAPENELTLTSMEELIREGKIILFDIQQAGLARSMGTFVKLQFEQAVLNLLSELRGKPMPFTTAMIIDEYQDVVTCGSGGTVGDDTYMAKARESRPAVMVATQSLSSLMDSVGSERSAKVLVQNFRTRIACHSSDVETVNWFKELAGKTEVETETHSYSENSPQARLNLIAGGFDSPNSSLNESVSRSERSDDLISGREFSRLKTFEAFAQVFDGVETKFLKLYLKPNFLKRINTKHNDVLAQLIDKGAKKVSRLRCVLSAIKNAAAMVLFTSSAGAAIIPNVCTVASSPAFNSCLEMTTSACMCGYPPHPCALISYYVPQTFIEVWPEPKTSYFSVMPGVQAQLSKVVAVPFGAEADNDTFSAHAHLLSIPLTSLVFQSMPAGGTRNEKQCFDGMTEDFGDQWKTGKGDLLQPSFLAWSASPKACLVSGALTSAAGQTVGAPLPDSVMCSFKLPLTSVLPPSSHSVCNGWGIFYPRHGTYNGPASLTGALMIASRARSLSSEVLRTSPQGADEKWQMIYPQSSSCFREGQNVGILETLKSAHETERIVNGKLKGYLFAVWAKTTTCKEMASVAQAQAAARAIPLACVGF